MSIESELFADYRVDRDALPAYGFTPEGETLIFRKPLPEDHLEIVLEYNGTFCGRIMDLSTGDEYVNYRMEATAGYSAGIRQKYTDLLLDIREKCCRNQYYKSAQAQRICAYICETYRCAPEFLWPNIPTFAAFRRENSKKWFAVFGSVPRNKVDPRSREDEAVEVINVKAGGGMIQQLLPKNGYYPGYHMNKKSWCSIIFDDTLPDEEIQARIAESYKNV